MRKRGFAKAAAITMVMCLTVLTSGGCSGSTSETIDTSVHVEAQAAQYGVLETETSYIGSVSPGSTVNVTPLVQGTVKDLKVKVGDHVKAGDVLCQFDDTAADYSLQSAEDALATAKAGKKSAEDQAEAAAAQTKSSITQLESTLDGYEKQKKSAEDQLKQLKASKKKLKAAAEQAQTAYTTAKQQYKTAQTLLVNYEAWLTANPTCQTTAGLVACATGTTSQTTAGTISSADQSGASATTDTTGAGATTEMTETGASGTDTTESSAAAGSDTSAVYIPETTTQSAQDAAMQKQAQALLEALNKSGLTVEYLSENGLTALKENADDLEATATQASAGSSQVDTSISSLEQTIDQLKTQISATKKSLKSAKEVAEASKTGTDSLDAQIDAAETGVEAAQYQKDLYTVTAPMDGYIDAVNVKKDEVATAGMAAFTISAKQTLLVTFYVPEDVRNFLQIGDTVTVSEEDDSSKGNVSSIGTAVDSSTGLFKVEAEIIPDQAGQYASGTSINLAVVSSRADNQILIPYDAVYHDNDQAYVYVVSEEDGTAVRTDVTTGLYNDDTIAVTSGLSEGTQVITTWASGLKDGAQVVIEQ